MYVCMYVCVYVCVFGPESIRMDNKEEHKLKQQLFVHHLRKGRPKKNAVTTSNGINVSMVSPNSTQRLGPPAWTFAWMPGWHRASARLGDSPSPVRALQGFHCCDFPRFETGR